MEHVNRTCKEAIQHLGANLTPQAIVQCGKARGKLTKVMENFDTINGIATSGSNIRRSDREDFEKNSGGTHGKRSLQKPSRKTTPQVSQI